MDLAALVVFAGALLIAAGSPGPSIAALVSRVLTRGWRDVLPFAAAMWIGEAIWLTMAVYGLATLAETLHWAFIALKYLGVAYLLYLAWKMWFAPVDIEAESSATRPKSALRMFLAGLAVTLGNPKIMVFYLALLPTIIDLAGITFVAWLELTVTMLIVLAAIDLGYIVLAGRARQLMKSPRAMRIANRVGATVMGGAAAAIASK
ncbi:LysE family translocator [Pelagibius sp. Alg239-R121]|uniref:LysE family translocator n=1 Tax=Pelagibius sp. Alg239-R121 TaxID=2993448 RepID=UPI0024A73447|nr:LysE family translocator [Pelagibius sp. Alg239-R121]